MIGMMEQIFSHGDTEHMEMDENQIGDALIDCAIYVHRGLGPGLLENVYEIVLFRELEKRGVSVQRQVPVPIEFDGTQLNEVEVYNTSTKTLRKFSYPMQHKRFMHSSAVLQH